MGITICAIAAGAGRSRAGTLRLKENASARRLLLQTYVAASADVSFWHLATDLQLDGKRSLSEVGSTDRRNTF